MQKQVLAAAGYNLSFPPTPGEGAAATGELEEEAGGRTTEKTESGGGKETAPGGDEIVSGCPSCCFFSGLALNHFKVLSTLMTCPDYRH